ncbi:MAG: Ig-like domain-containing protein [Gemmatimonadales bacterium]
MKLIRSLGRAIAAGLTGAVALSSSVAAQDAASITKLVAEPAALTLRAGDSARIVVKAVDAQGREVRGATVRVFGARRAVAYEDGMVRAFQAGKHGLVAFAERPGACGGSECAPLQLEIPVTVTWPAVARLQIVTAPSRFYTGATVVHTVKGTHADGSERPGLTANWRSSNPAVATVDRFGNVRTAGAGAVTITADADGQTATVAHTVVANPVTEITIGIRDTTLRTGDVLQLTASARRANGQAVADAPFTWSYTYAAADTVLPSGIPGGAGIVQYGMFTGNYPGRYTLIARSGNAFAERTIEVKPRDSRRPIVVTGRGNINHTHTSDLWPWTGKDGRDYVLVGTWGGDGYAYTYDITDLNNPIKTDSVKIDARTINDVTVSPDGRYGVLSREGASNRVNGVVILDLATPAHPKVAATFNQELTGGVHNMFATNDYLFAVSGGAKYVIIDVKDIYKPKYVSEYRHPNARLHDLWVHDGIAYSAQGGVGTIVVDVGNGKYGGSIEKPKLITTYELNSGHEIFPYFQKSTGKVYLFIGDEEMNRSNRVWAGTNYRNEMTTPGGMPQTSGGMVHIVDFTDPMKPKPVGRYELEDFGSHDIVVEDDILYQAYYEGGVRLVDVSGELMGNLRDQGREIAVFKPYDPKGYTPNAAFVMNAMPWKGHVLFTDFNTGLWSAKLAPKNMTP